MAEEGTLKTEEEDSKLTELLEMSTEDRMKLMDEFLAEEKARREFAAKLQKANAVAEAKLDEDYGQTVADAIQEAIDLAPKAARCRLYQASITKDDDGEVVVTVTMVGGRVSPSASDGSSRIAEGQKPADLTKKAWHQAVWLDTRWSASKIAKYCGTNSGHVSNSLRELAEYQAYQASKNGN